MEARAPERVEETGRRARGRKQGSVTRQRERPELGADEPFTGTVLPSAAKTARVAEAKRCVKHLKLTVADLGPRQRKQAEAA